MADAFKNPQSRSCNETYKPAKDRIEIESEDELEEEDSEKEDSEEETL